MAKASSTGQPAGPRAARRDARAERLAAALKTNLQRRKVQARGRAAEAHEPGRDGGPSGSHDSAGIVADKPSG